MEIADGLSFPTSISDRESSDHGAIIVFFDAKCTVEQVDDYLTAGMLIFKRGGAAARGSRTLVET